MLHGRLAKRSPEGSLGLLLPLPASFLCGAVVGQYSPHGRPQCIAQVPIRLLAIPRRRVGRLGHGRGDSCPEARGADVAAARVLRHDPRPLSAAGL
jgi:hypothetical protein